MCLQGVGATVSLPLPRLPMDMDSCDTEVAKDASSLLSSREGPVAIDDSLSPAGSMSEDALISGVNRAH